MNIAKTIETPTTELNKTAISILKGIGISLVVTFIALAIYSAILTYTNTAEATMKPVIIILTAISILMGSMITTSKLKKNGLINGGIVGLAYIMIIYIISSIAQVGFSLNMYSIIMIIVSILMGALGGIIGVNIRR